MNLKVLVISPTYNEKKNISELIDRISKTSDLIDILIIDDNSPDCTAELVRSIMNDNNHIHLLEREKKLGLNTAHIMAYEYALKNNYDKLITLDADFSHDPNEITKIINQEMHNIIEEDDINIV